MSVSKLAGTSVEGGYGGPTPGIFGYCKCRLVEGLECAIIGGQGTEIVHH